MRLGIEDSVAAADIGDERMRLADAVAQVELVVVAGAAAGAVVFSVGQRVGEDAVLHVEHGHVLVDDHFEKCGIDAGEQGAELIPIQIVRRDEALEAGF